MSQTYITLRQVVDDFAITLDGDDYASGVSDMAIRNFALRGIREFGFDVSAKIKSLKLPVNTTTNTVELPDDFVSIIKVGVVSGDGILYVMGKNSNMNSSRAYVDPTSTSDSEVGPLNIEENIIQNRVDSKSPTLGFGSGVDSTNGLNSYVFRNYIYGSSLGRLYGYGGGNLYGDYRLNLDQDRIELESGASTQEVVIEYIADEARSTNPTVHVQAEEALRSYIYYKICERKSNVPANEKARARTEYYNERRKARARMNDFSKEEALKVIRKNFKQSPKY